MTKKAMNKPWGYKFKEVKDLMKTFSFDEVEEVGSFGFGYLKPTKSNPHVEVVVEVIAGVFRRPKHHATDNRGGQIPLRVVGKMVFDQEGLCYAQDQNGNWTPLPASAGIPPACIGPQKKSARITISGQR